MLNDYTYVDAKRRIDKHLAPFFGNKRMSSSMASDIRACIAKRLADNVPRSPGSADMVRAGIPDEIERSQDPQRIDRYNVVSVETCGTRRPGWPHWRAH